MEKMKKKGFMKSVFAGILALLLLLAPACGNEISVLTDASETESGSPMQSLSEESPTASEESIGTDTLPSESEFPSSETLVTDTPSGETPPSTESPVYPTETPEYDGTLAFSEIAPNNTVYPVNGVIVNYVELYNAGENTVSLSEYILSDVSGDTSSFLPAGELKPGAYTVIPESALNFKLSSVGKTLYLCRKGEKAIQISYPDAEKNKAYCGGMWAQPTPGYPNTEEGYTKYVNARSGLIINEVISSNSKYNAKSGEYYDMVELKNATDEKLWVGGYYLTDSKKDLKKYNLPDVTLEPGELYTVYLSGSVYDGLCPFSLSKDGEFLAVSDYTGKVSDAFSLPYIPVDRSWGRTADGMRYFETPSFGKANGSGCRYLSGKPEMSAKSGFYSESFDVTFTNASDGTIYYTTDGTRPTVSSKRYAGEIIPVKSSMTVRAFLAEDGKITGENTAFDFFIDTPDYELPIMKMTVGYEGMYGENGIYTNYQSKEIETEGHISFYENGIEQFSLDCGYKVVGNYSRRYDKKSYQVKFRSKYGESKLKYDLFGDGEITEFHGFVLRSGSQDIPLAMMRDEFACSVVSAMSDEILTQKFRPVNLYINEKYVGVYYVREKVNEDFVASHYDVSPESVTIIANLMYLEYGSDIGDWEDVWYFIKHNDLSVKENYDYICEHISIDSVIDYYIALAWADNRDEGNTRLFRSTEGDGKWRFIFYDSDMGFGSYLQYKNASTVEFLYGEYTIEDGVNNALIFKLFKNATFKDLFLRRLAELTKTAFSNANVLAKIEKIRSAIDRDMHDQPYSNYNNWSQTQVPQLISYVTDRSNVLINEFSKYFGLSDAERAKYFS